MAGSAHPATIRQAVVLVGGLGSRLGALAADTPKPLLEVGDRPFLAWVLRELCRYGVERVLLLADRHAERWRAALPGIAASLPRRLDIDIAAEAEPAGTGGALHRARERLDRRFLLLNGDSLMDSNWAALLADAAGDDPGVLARLLLRRDDPSGRCSRVTLDGARVAAFGGAPAGPAHAGVAVLSREMLDHAEATCSLEHDVYPGSPPPASCAARCGTAGSSTSARRSTSPAPAPRCRRGSAGVAR